MSSDQVQVRVTAVPARIVAGRGVIARLAPSPLRGWEVPPQPAVPARIVAGRGVIARLLSPPSRRASSPD